LLKERCLTREQRWPPGLLRRYLLPRGITQRIRENNAIHGSWRKT
jgi:hypothetical protein